MEIKQQKKLVSGTLSLPLSTRNIDFYVKSEQIENFYQFFLLMGEIVKSFTPYSYEGNGYVPKFTVVSTGKKHEELNIMNCKNLDSFINFLKSAEFFVVFDEKELPSYEIVGIKTFLLSHLKHRMYNLIADIEVLKAFNSAAASENGYQEVFSQMRALFQHCTLGSFSSQKRDCDK